MEAWRRETFESPPRTRLAPASRPIVNSPPVTSIVWPALGPDVILSCSGKARPTLTRVGSFRHSPGDQFAARSQLGLGVRRRDTQERADRRRREELDLERRGLGAGERQRLLEGRHEDALVDVAVQPLMVLLGEEAPGYAIAVTLELELKPEQVREPAAEAELVVAERQRSSSWRST